MDKQQADLVAVKLTQTVLSNMTFKLGYTNNPKIAKDIADFVKLLSQNLQQESTAIQAQDKIE